MRKKDKDKIIEKVINGNIETKEEKEVYLEYLNGTMNNLINQNKEDKRDNFKKIFKDWLDIYKSNRDIKDGYIKYNGVLPGFVDLFSLSSLIAFIIEILTLHTFISLTILLSLQSILIFKSLAKSIFKKYFPLKKQVKLKFIKEKLELEEEIKEVEKLQFEEEKKQAIADINYSHEERYLFDAKEKTKTYERITNLIIKIKDIENEEMKKRLAFELQQVLRAFDEARIKFEKLSPNAQNLLIQDKVKVEMYVETELDKLENEIETFMNKETRMAEDSKIVKTLSDELTQITRRI